MTYYEVLLFGHIAFAAIWVGAAVTLFALSLRSKSADPQIMAAVGPHSAWLAQRIFIPSSLAVLLLGILLVIEGPWGFDQLWILLGFAIFAATFVVGLFMIEPTAKELTEVMQAGGPGSPEATKLDRRLYALSWVDLALLAAVLWDMTLKPRGEDVGALLVLALVLAAAVVNAVRVYRDTESAARPAA